MPLGLRALYPKRAIGPQADRLETDADAALLQYGHAVAAKMAVYPPQIPPQTVRASVDKRGRVRVRLGGASGRKPYRRTGDYGRAWSAPTAVTVRNATVTVVNRVQHGGRSYSVYVGGPKEGPGPGQRQAKVMARRGWVSITDVGRSLVKQYQPIVNRAVVGRAR